MNLPDDTAAQDLAGESDTRAASLPDAPTGGDDPLGREIAGRYRLESLLGVGALGRTYRAQRIEDGAVEGQVVALKLLHAHHRDDDEFKRRLTREVEAARNIEHKHVARVFEIGSDEREGLYICRELLEGQDLIAAVQRGKRSPRRICELLIQVLSAVAEAHRHGALHRNLKPQNVFVHVDGEQRECVTLCDFGNPLRARPGAEYMAPEQADSHAIDGQADVYAVGIMLYELLTGDVPFRGATPRETLSLHKSAALVPPREKRPDRPLPRELEAVCLKALAREPRERHRSPREMSQALRAVVSLLGARAEEPLGSSAFVDPGATVPSPSLQRMTMPGEQLRSRTKFWLGAALVVAVCVTVFMSPAAERVRQPSELARSARDRDGAGQGGKELADGIVRLRAGDAEGAVPALRSAREALGDTPEVLRALGEALVIQGSRSEGTSLLSRYLELEPSARDREFVESLIRRSDQPATR